MMPICIGVRELVHLVCRTGGLTGASFGNWNSAATGTRAHQAFFKQLRRHFPGAAAVTEHPVRLDWSDGDLQIQVRGRADIRLTGDAPLLTADTSGIRTPAHAVILEVKTTAQPLDALPPDGQRLHWLQCAFYTYIQAVQDGLHDQAVLTYGLAYISSDTLEARFLYRQESLCSLRSTVETVLTLYSGRARDRQRDQLVRDQSIHALRFPYPSLREGQKRMMQAVLGTIGERHTLLAEAPTGIGKTLSALYPAIKALGHDRCDRIFYLTAKTAVREVAASALAELRGAGLFLRSITLTAREKICFRPDICCETALCEYADGYYDRLSDALTHLLRGQAFDRSAIESAARKYRLCPFELGLDLAHWCEVIIGDYNHGFDPRSRLMLLGNSDERHVLLVDEAHNLPDRARTMFSAALSHRTVLACRDALEQLDPKLPAVVAPVCRYFETLIEAAQTGRAGFDSVEKDLSPDQILQAERFRSVSCRAPWLCQRLHRFISACRPLLDQIEDYAIKKPILNLFFDAAFFIRVCDEFWSREYILMLRPGESDWYLEQACMDASAHLSRQKTSAQSRIFFSATLTPLSYYAATLCGTAPDNRPDTLALPSPFDPTHLNMLLVPVSTVYRDRGRTAEQIARLIALTIRQQPVNQLIYFSSYAYLNQIYPMVRRALSDWNGRLIRQRRAMDDAKHQLFLRQFETGTAGRPVAGFAVLGGVFGEGIDLTGERLGGVICVGTGLPQLSPQLEILRNYYDAKGENGFLYAYIYPGFNKIMQAAGRLIRTETDAGFVLLIDDRYRHRDYQLLFPAWWQVHVAETPGELSELLSETLQMEATD